MSFLLIFLTIGPLPPAFAASFPGSIEGGTADSLTGLGTVRVTNATQGETLQLYSEKAGSTPVQTKTNTPGDHIFTGLEPGIYRVTTTATAAGSSESDRSPAVSVLPRAVTVSNTPQVIDGITVTKAEKKATLILYNDRDGFRELSTEADDFGIGAFTGIPAGTNYRVKQSVNGVESALSTDITIKPVTVELIVSENNESAGPNNDRGSFRVVKTKIGNILSLYRNDKFVDTYTVTSAEGYTFSGLSAAKYHVTQTENGAESLQSEPVYIRDQMAPTISFVKPDTERFSLPQTFIPKKSDVIVDDNLGADNVTVTLSPEMYKFDNDVRTPGVHKITYTATDTDGNKTSIIKTVTIAPPTLDINKAVHTSISDENPPGRAHGDIWVDNVMAEATLKVYQDPGGKVIKTITRANDSSTGLFEITGIPVGIQYYVTQVVNGIESETSSRIDIKDTTKPTIQLLDKSVIEFVRGDSYIEYGARATDNVDNATQLSSKIVIDSSRVNMNIPGKYSVTYNVMDNAGNIANTVTRTIVISPHAVIAIGSNADLGEVGVKNAFPGVVLKLYSVTDSTTPIAISKPLPTDITTYVFKNPTLADGTIPNTNMKIPPGSYYVIQEFSIGEIEPLKSMRSNIVDVKDMNRPYITITGSENLFFIWNKSDNDYTYNSGMNIGQFADPGATAEDYLDDDVELTNSIKTKATFGTTELCNENILTNPPCAQLIDMVVPGVYTITYSVTTKRGAKADDKQRIITIAPPKVGQLEAKSGKSSIEVADVFMHPQTKTTVNLYDTYNKLVKSITPKVDGTALFEDIPAGLGYYVTQTVNGIESALSNPVNVSLFEAANDAALITAFEFTAESAYGVIDHRAGTIDVVVPKNTVIKKLKAKFEATGVVTVDTIKQTNAISEQDFSKPVIYKVTPADGKQPKEYTVTVTKETFVTDTWTTTIHKIESFSLSGSIHTLTPDEKLLAKNDKKGVSFIGRDRAIHVPYANVNEASNPALTVKTAAIETYAADPVWSRNITQSTDIKWGNSTQSFMRPIEVELANPGSKKFARIIRSNSQLFAVILQSEIQNDNLIGLATESGTYALIASDIAKPNITPHIANGQTTYSLSAVAGAQIYYTTNSSHVAFDRSARKATLNSYTLDGSPANLSDWTRYTAGQQISTPSGELFAFVMKDNVISPLNHVEAVASTEWRSTVTKPTSHIFTVTFNAKVDRKALYADMIYVIDDSTKEKVATTLELSTDGKKISVIPVNAYTRNKQYTLHIERQFKGNTKTNEFLKQPLTQTFVAQ